MEKIEIKINAVEVTQGKGKRTMNGKEKLAYVGIPEHWVEGEIIIALVRPSDFMDITETTKK